MVQPAEQASNDSRRIVCSGCGAQFGCNPAGPCWCADEAFRLPMPVDSGDCLCPACLRQAAADQAGVGDMMPRRNIKAVLLDMDGTLLDTEKVYLESLVSALAAFGYSEGVVTLCHAMVGIPALECEAMLRERYGDDFPLSQLRQAFIARRDEILGSGLPLKPGAIDLLDALRETELPLAIVTSSSRRTADEHLTLAGIRTRFETIVTRDDVMRGKPSPDLYLLAASRFGVKPEFCLAIEDSNPGVAAAHAAGAITLMVPDIVPPSAESRAKCAAVLPDLGAVLTMLRQHDRWRLDR